jgi:hypothetical protein
MTKLVNSLLGSFHSAYSKEKVLALFKKAASHLFKKGKVDCFGGYLVMLRPANKELKCRQGKEISKGQPN